MRRLVIASTRENAGKTSLIVGLGRASGKPFGYLKPFGDRLLYRKKRLWDYDSALVGQVFELAMDPREMSLGFDHSKLRFMYDEETTRKKLVDLVVNAESGKEAVLIESGGDVVHRRVEPRQDPAVDQVIALHVAGRLEAVDLGIHREEAV